MSAGGYDGPHMSSTFSRYEPRRSQGSIPTSYDRPPNGPPRRRTPSPGPSRRPYDSYVPHRPDVALREGMPNVYRPNNYRPEYSAGKYYSRSPSPDPYIAPSRLPEPEPWDRASAWRPPPPPPLDISNPWPERKNIPPSPTTSAPGRGPRDDPSTRIFEPSATWKQTHVDRPIRAEHSPSSERFFGRRGRGSIDGSPDRPMLRNDRPPAFIPGGERYRPGPISSKRDSFSNGRHEYDSYRPPPSDNGWTAPIRRDPISPSSSHHRRDSGSFTTARTLSHHDSPRASRPVSRKASPAPFPADAVPIKTPIRSTPDSESWNFIALAKRQTPARPPSRSSIASTQVSDRKSPAAIPTPESSIQSQTVASILTVTEVPTANGQEEPIKDAKGSTPASNKISNGPIDQVPVQSGNEPKVTQDNVTAVENKSVPDVSIIPNIISPAAKRSLNIIKSPVKTTTDAVLPLKGVGKPGPVKPTEYELPAAPIPAASRTSAPVAAPAPTPPPVSQPLVKDEGTTEIKQPIPSYVPAPVLNPVDEDMDINIPPTTHSPVLGTHSPDIPGSDRASPVASRPVLPTPEEIPQVSELKTAQEALRMVVMTRMLYDRQTREQRVNPVLLSNLSIAAPLEVHPTATPETLLEKMSTGQPLRDKMDSFICTRPKLTSYLRQRHAMVEEKIARLREEYVSLQERWIEHCNALNEQQKTLASEHEMQHGGRTTRRSTAITDAVRSDFEMEQIIASLGVDDATDPNCLSLRNNAKIPDMISVVNGQIDYVFDDTAHRVENPAEYYAPKTGIHDWTEEEKKIFIDKFAASPKQFGIIAEFLPNKTAAQCVDYYYLHKKKFIDFRKVVSQFAPNKRKRRGMGKKKGNGLLADIAMHDMEVRGSAAAAQSASAIARAPRGRKTVAPPEQKKTSSRRNAVQFEDTPTSTPTPEPESTRTRRKRTTVPSTPLASTPVVATPEPAPAPTLAPAPAPAPAPSISAPSLVQKPHPPTALQQEETPDHDADARPTKRVKRTRKIKSAATISDEHLSPGPEIDKQLPSGSTNTTDVSDANNRGKKDKPNPATWSEEDKSLFLSLLSQYGDNFKRIAASMPNKVPILHFFSVVATYEGALAPKTTIQVSNYFSNHKLELRLDAIVASAPKRSPTPEQNEAWKELPYQGSSGILTPASTPHSNVLSTSRPPTPPPPMASLSQDSSGRYPYHLTTSSVAAKGNLASFRNSGRTSFGEPLPLRSAPLFGSQERQRIHSMSSQSPPMARLGNNGPSERRASMHGTSIPPSRNPQYIYPNQRGGSLPGKHADDGPNHPYSISSPQTLSKQPHFAPMYPSSAPPNGRPGYTPTTPVTSVSNATPIIHSPTGMSPPKPPMSSHACFPQHIESSHHTSYYPPSLSDPRANPNWGPPSQQRFYNPDGMTSYIGNGRRRASGSSEDRNGGSIRRENPYPVLSHPLPHVASTRGPNAPYASQSPASSTGPARPAQYYPGWTPIP